jgi:hypothetical protein
MYTDFLRKLWLSLVTLLPAAFLQESDVFAITVSDTEEMFT